MALLDFLLMGRIGRQKLPRPLLGRLATAVGSLNLLHGASASLARSREQGRRKRIGLVALKSPEVNGNLQLLPLMRQAAAFCLKPGVDIGELPAKMDHRTHRFTEEPKANSAAPTSECELVTKIFVDPGGCPGGAGRPASRMPRAGRCSPTT